LIATASDKSGPPPMPSTAFRTVAKAGVAATTDFRPFRPLRLVYRADALTPASIVTRRSGMRRNGGHRPRVLRELAEEGAEHEKPEELGEEPCRAPHEGLRPVRENGLAREQSRSDCRQRRQEQHTPTFESEPD
jgi:hypothetical protein